MVLIRTASVSIISKSSSTSPLLIMISGFGDNVKCFYCNGGLRNWEKGDEPWHEHARWFPRCPYVVMVKGQDYVNSVSAESREDAPILAQSRRNVSSGVEITMVDIILYL